MKVWTYKEASTKVLLDLDMNEEDFTTPDELAGYFNEAIQEAEAEIHKLGVEDDYFLKSAPISFSQGIQTYALPTDIYIGKIRGVVYKDSNTNIYPIKRIRRSEKEFIDYEDTLSNGVAEDYRYMITNPDVDTGMQLVFFPPPRLSGPYVTVWYVRNAKRVPLPSEGSQAATDATKIDVPEFINFIMQYVKCRIMVKDQHPLLEGNMGILQQQRKLMVDTLTQMVVDDDDLIQPDFSHYRQMS